MLAIAVRKSPNNDFERVFGVTEWTPRPLKPLRDSAGKQVHLFARTLWMDTADIACRVSLEEPLDVHGHQIAPNLDIIPAEGGGFYRVLTLHRKLMAASRLSTCTVIAASPTPWTSELAVGVLAGAFEGVTHLTDAATAVRRVQRVTAEGEGDDSNFDTLFNSAFRTSDTFTLMAHVLEARKSEAKMKALQAVLDKCPLLLNTVLVIDPDRLKFFREQITNIPERWNNGYGIMTPHAGSKASPLVADLVRTLPKAPTDFDPDKAAEYMLRFAGIRCSPDWPYTKYVHNMVDYFGYRLAGFDHQGDLRSMALRIAHTTDAYTKVAAEKKILQEQSSAAQQDAAQAEQRAEQAEQKADAFCSQTEGKIRVLLKSVERLRTEGEQAGAKADELEQELLRLRARGGADDSTVQELEQTIAELRRALRASEAHKRELMNRRENGQEASLRAPERWEELYECALALENVRMLPEAVEPALKNLAQHGKASKVWLDRVWTALNYMDIYAVDEDGYSSFTSFVQANPTDHLTAAHVAAGESTQVMAQAAMVAQRTFNTEQGPMVMAENVRICEKPQWGRIHYTERTVNGVRTIYVGYIGQHLRNMQTTHM